MSVLPLAKIGLVLNRPHYVEEAKRQFMLHVKYLADPQTGLWFHGKFDETTWKSKQSANSPLPHRLDFRRTSQLQQSTLGVHLHVLLPLPSLHTDRRRRRGNCWITVAIPDFIELLQLPSTDGLRMFLVSTLVAQIDALVKYQDPESGLWHTILDDPTSYLEASASAGFAYGILKSLRLRLIPRYVPLHLCDVDAADGDRFAGRSDI